MTRRRPHITDHAMLRYLERVVGIEVDRHRHDVERLVGGAVTLGACGLISGGFRYAISEFRVTTVVPASSEPAFPRMQPGEDGQDD